MKWNRLLLENPEREIPTTLVGERLMDRLERSIRLHM